MIRKLMLLSALLLTQHAWAGIYKYIDASGGIHYTDEPRNRTHKHNDTPCGVHVYTDNSTGITKITGRSCAPKVSLAANNYNSPNPGRRAGSMVSRSAYNDLIAQTASRHQVDERLVHAVIQTESAYNADAVSSAGAVGLMQLMPGTARRFGVMDRRDPVQNVEGGTRYLKELLGMFNSNLGLAVAAYNAGEGAVMKYNYSIPPYPETQNYVRQVLARYNRYN